MTLQGGRKIGGRTVAVATSSHAIQHSAAQPPGVARIAVVRGHGVLDRVQRAAAPLLGAAAAGSQLHQDKGGALDRPVHSLRAKRRRQRDCLSMHAQLHSNSCRHRRNRRNRRRNRRNRRQLCNDHGHDHGHDHGRRLRQCQAPVQAPVPPVAGCPPTAAAA
jgi:hypothetical protein